jgi:hypothetical protein
MGERVDPSVSRGFDMPFRAWCQGFLHGILRLNFAVLSKAFDPAPVLFQCSERCRIMPTLTQNQATLLLYFFGSGRKLDPIRIMKGMFVFTMEAPESWLSKEGRYHFFAYSWGPYSREIESDLVRLNRYGYLSESQAPGKNWSYYSLSEQGQEKAQELAKEFPPAVTGYLSKVREFLLTLTFRRLLDTIYARYPNYAVNSVFKR